MSKISMLSARSSSTAEQKQLRILVVVDGVFPSTGGAEIQARLQARSLAAAGHDVTVMAPHIRSTHALRETLDGVPVERIAYPKIKWLGAIVLCAKLAMLLLARRRRYDAIHVHTADILSAVAGIVRPAIDATLVVKISGAWEFDGGLLDPRLRSSAFYRFLNACLRRADHIQCISEHTRRMVIDAGYSQSQVSMIPNAVDMQRFVPSTPTSSVPVVAFVGRLVPVKGVAVLVEAWARVVARTRARLVVVGDGTERISLEARVRELGIADCVEFKGELADVISVLRFASLYVQPSFQEGMPNSVLEAMACGLPIVATQVGGNEDLVEGNGNGLLVPVGDSVAMGRAIVDLLCDTARATAMGHRSREIVEQRYAVPTVLRHLLGVYGTSGQRRGHA